VQGKPYESDIKSTNLTSNMTLQVRQSIHANHPSTRLRVGDVVSYKEVRCTIEAIWRNAPHTQTGTLVALKPRVDDKWCDAAWIKVCVDDGLDFEEDDGLDT
jgi:hypothetical protein